MPIPDRIERTIELAQPPQRVWEALTSAEGLGSWPGDKELGELAGLQRVLDAPAPPGHRSPRTVRTTEEDA